MSVDVDVDAARGRRHETELRIELAALNAAIELGFENVTVDEISSRAEIARSTFFTYFNARDSAILGRAIDVLEGEAAAAVFEQDVDDLPLGIFRLIYASAAQSRPDPEVARLRAELAAAQPLASLAATAILTDAGVQIMAALAEWLTANPQHARMPGSPAAEASLTSNAAYAGISTLPGGWLAATLDIESSTARFRAALDDLRVVMGA